MTDQNDTPIITRKDHLSPSVFTPENMLREARRQKSIPEGTVWWWKGSREGGNRNYRAIGRSGF